VAVLFLNALGNIFWWPKCHLLFYYFSLDFCYDLEKYIFLEWDGKNCILGVKVDRKLLWVKISVLDAKQSFRSCKNKFLILLSKTVLLKHFSVIQVCNRDHNMS
jgi:hypothetical protein